MRPQTKDDIIDSLEGIIEDLRAILVQQGDDTAILNEARVALSDWFIATYPHLYEVPRRSRDHLRLVRGGGRRSRSKRQAPLLSSIKETP